MRRPTAFLLGAVILLSCTACSGGTSSVSEPLTGEVSASTSEAAEESAEQTTSAADTTSAQPETEEPVPEEIEPRSFGDITLSELETAPTILEKGRNVLGNIKRLSGISHYIIDERLYISQDFYVRNSSRALRKQEDIAGFRELLNDAHYNLSSYYDTEYEITWKNGVIEFENNFTGSPNIKSYEMGYVVTQEITTRGFIRKNGEDGIEFIIDPAYTYGLPMFTSLEESLSFDINGTEIYADTLMFKADVTDQNDRDWLTEDYCYAKVTVANPYVNYTAAPRGEFRGYDNECVITSMELITEDTDLINESGFFMSSVEKDPVMSETYNAIVNSLDTVYKETVIGMTLLDLDFDGTPELLVSDRAEIADDVVTAFDEPIGADVSIYRIENGALKYIGTMYSMISRQFSPWGNVLGLKALPDGSRAWYCPSYKDRTTGDYVDGMTDYLYTLEGDRLIATEAYGIHNIEVKQREDGTKYLSYDEYEYGAEIVPTVTEIKPDEEGYLSDKLYEWNGFSTIFGELMYDELREAYWSDITEHYNLCSEWLRGDNFTPKSVTERELTYNLAYLVDCFYLGEYNPAKQEFYYGFLGAIAKPVIYLYPEETIEVSVKVGFADEGEITVSYPEYGEGWEVTAHPDGALFDRDGNEYYCLYWEGEGGAALDMSRGWCVSGADTAEFLREKLLHIGLTAREANEFIIYWLPLMQKNEYNIISFHTEEYSAAVPMTVAPAPDSMIRVFMTYTPVEEFTEIPPQELPSYERNGFTVVEWGGGLAEK